MIPTERRHRQQTISRNSSSQHDSNFHNPTNNTTNSNSISTPSTSKQQPTPHIIDKFKGAPEGLTDQVSKMYQQQHPS
jgi:hypothetical protein